MILVVVLVDHHAAGLRGPDPAVRTVAARRLRAGVRALADWMVITGILLLVVVALQALAAERAGALVTPHLEGLVEVR